MSDIQPGHSISHDGSGVETPAKGGFFAKMFGKGNDATHQHGEDAPKIKIDNKVINLNNPGNDLKAAIKHAEETGTVKVGEKYIDKYVTAFAIASGNQLAGDSKLNAEFQTTVDALKLMDAGQTKDFEHAKKLVMMSAPKSETQGAKKPYIPYKPSPDRPGNNSKQLEKVA